MKQIQRPVMFTIGFGMAAGLAFIPATIILSRIVYWPTAFNLVLWSYLAMYCGFLAKWQGIGLIRTVIPLSLVLGVIFYGAPTPLFMLICLGILAWVRSGIRPHRPGAGLMLTEVITSIGGAAIVAWFTPDTSASWAIGTFLFFLVQALYFPLMGIPEDAPGVKSPGDLFENARKQAEKILFELR